MTKETALQALGQQPLLLPALLREALKANDRLKLALSLLQAAAHRVQTPQAPPVDLSREIAATDVGLYENVQWLRELPNLAEPDAGGLRLPGLERLRGRLRDDLGRMAAPLADGGAKQFAPRVTMWNTQLQATGDHLSFDALAALTHARRGESDSLHLLVMDLHKALNALAAKLSEQDIAGAHTWQLAADGSDAPRVEAFMRGVQSTAAARLDHPGLDTTATRDGDRLLIQNDIGTSDAHVLVLQVRGLVTTLTYSDLHAQRFAFFQRSLAEAGAAWGEDVRRASQGLNAGAAFHVGTATFKAEDEDGLLRQLQGIGERIVFLIDWNRARKQLVPLVGKRVALQVLEAAASRHVGHVAWLRAGGAQLVWNAMAAQPQADFHLGERLDDVLAPEAARDILLELLTLARQAADGGHPPTLLADQARLLLSRSLAGRHRGFGLLQEHAALCHALAQALEDGIVHGALTDAVAAQRLARRAQDWEHEADELVSRARAQAERQSRWRPIAQLLEAADDISDALEEAAFTMTVLAQSGAAEWRKPVREPLEALAHAVLQAVQDHVRALQVAAALELPGDGEDRVEYLDTLWRIQQAERRCDQLQRSFRLAAARELQQAAELVLGNELAAALEAASDAMLSFGWRLRDHAFGALHGGAR